MEAAAADLIKSFTERMEQAEALISTLGQKLARLEEVNAQLRAQKSASAGPASAAPAAFASEAEKADVVNNLKLLKETIVREKEAAEQLVREKEELALANEKLKYRVQHLLRSLDEVRPPVPSS